MTNNSQESIISNMPKRAVELKSYFLKDINPVIRFMIISDTVILGAGGLLGPVFAIFIEDFIQNGDAAVAGVAAGIYLFAKSIFQIPIAHLIDRIRGEKDDFWLMFVFSILTAIIPILYLVIKTPLQLYLVEFLLGVFTAFTFPTFMAMYTRHIDKKKEGTEWGVYFTLTDITSAVLAAVGGYVATVQGFPTLIILVVVMSLVGALLLWPVRAYIRGK